MRHYLILFAAASVLAAPAVAKNAVYMSLMGEPFRTNAAGEEPFDQWFGLADENGDSAISRLEFRGDAEAFFSALDSNGDKVIDADEMRDYEHLAPGRTRAAGGGAAELSSKRPTAKSSAPVEKGQVAIVAHGDAPSATRVHPSNARTDYSAVPQPVAMADLNLDRRVTLDEFVKTAGKRFTNYDVDKDGRLTRKELK